VDVVKKQNELRINGMTAKEIVFKWPRGKRAFARALAHGTTIGDIMKTDDRGEPVPITQEEYQQAVPYAYELATNPPDVDPTKDRLKKQTKKDHRPGCR
jgi:hypothetical protein